jgi:hypothetical protein
MLRPTFVAIASAGLLAGLAGPASPATPDRGFGALTRCTFPTYKGAQYRPDVLRTIRVEVGARVGTAILYRPVGIGPECRAVRIPVYRIKGISASKAVSREGSRREILTGREVCYPRRGGDAWLLKCLRK